ncbi:MAG: hypothetical protein LBU67_07730 [Oscillospiraceae bacterium]|jgi:hypothetical protein|nr:hypothetical protein [Oscillospiraceae bacterium]
MLLDGNAVVPVNIAICNPTDVDSLSAAVRSMLYEYSANTARKYGMAVYPKDWKNDANQGIDTTVQTVLDKQIIDRSLAGIFIFGDTLGREPDTVTATCHELERMIKQNKRVFVYFRKPRSNYTPLEIPAYYKTQEFKKNYGKKGFYGEYDDEKSLVSLVCGQLDRYLYEESRKLLHDSHLYYNTMEAMKNAITEKQDNLIKYLEDYIRYPTTKIREKRAGIISRPEICLRSILKEIDTCLSNCLDVPIRSIASSMVYFIAKIPTNEGFRDVEDVPEDRSKNWFTVDNNQLKSLTFEHLFSPDSTLSQILKKEGKDFVFYNSKVDAEKTHKYVKSSSDENADGSIFCHRFFLNLSGELHVDAYLMTSSYHDYRFVPSENESNVSRVKNFISTTLVENFRPLITTELALIYIKHIEKRIEAFNCRYPECQKDIVNVN